MKILQRHNTSMHWVFIYSIIVLTYACSQPKKESIDNEEKVIHEKGTFGYDLDFLKEHYDDLVVLKNGNAQVIVSPALQGRVLTSTAEGAKGQSFGWLNHDLIASGEQMEHFNPIGGEERFWLGPEGGQFSIYFKPESSFDFENWYVPKEIDTEPFELVSSSSSQASFKKQMQLTNYSNTVFNLNVSRTIKLLNNQEISSALDTELTENIQAVGFESENIISNNGENNWDKNSGMLSIWILSMLNPSPSTAVVVPFKEGDETELGKIVTDDYFGKVPSDRLIVKDEVLFFKADGKKRSKIGLSPQRALPIAGSYDAQNQVLTIAQFTLPENNHDYVNSLWEIQDKPFAGDAVNSYNDGPLDNGDQLGPFYEIESSSPAANLAAGESLTHIHRTFHFKGESDDLNRLAKTLLKVDLNEIEKAFD
ncbi:hypothetical protein QQ008_08905 [Fulvivirgaceae bacterium BMA10]|uniref:Lipoprotein n=1 Tax=Splendidivirga corallicola TaxID=3051826 RepID=A0ABT8KMN4_9BACT|nr:hypothetical protein [Fulvivirgaceae bacterium BMA10]